MGLEGSGVVGAGQVCERDVEIRGGKSLDDGASDAFGAACDQGKAGVLLWHPWIVAERVGSRGDRESRGWKALRMSAMRIVAVCGGVWDVACQMAEGYLSWVGHSLYFPIRVILRLRRD